jgi:hypothetical protein
MIRALIIIITTTTTALLLTACHCALIITHRQGSTSPAKCEPDLLWPITSRLRGLSAADLCPPSSVNPPRRSDFLWLLALMVALGNSILIMLCYVMVPLLPPWLRPARPGGAFSHCLSGALSVSISITLRNAVASTEQHSSSYYYFYYYYYYYYYYYCCYWRPPRQL